MDYALKVHLRAEREKNKAALRDLKLRRSLERIRKMELRRLKA
jgi:hypothetical protein